MRHSHWFAAAVIPLLVFVSSGAPAQSDWTEFSSPDGKFTAIFPQSPEVNADRGNAGGITAITHILAASNIDVFCSVTFTDYSPRLDSSAREEMEANRDNFLSEFKAMLIESHDTVLAHAVGDALPAIAFSAANDVDTFRLFVAVDGLRSYMILAASQKASPDDDDMDRCIGGFRLTS
jgi:hypothetical protein